MDIDIMNKKIHAFETRIEALEQRVLELIGIKDEPEDDEPAAEAAAEPAAESEAETAAEPADEPAAEPAKDKPAK